MSEIDELKARIAALEAAAKPKPFVAEPMPKFDPTERMTLPPSAVAAMVGVVRPQDLVADARKRQAEPSSIAAEPTPKRGSGWAEEKPLKPHPRWEVELVDRIVERFVGGPNDPVR
jgi:hypothetical protein